MTRTTEQARREHTLKNWGADDQRPIKSPRFPTKSLHNDDLLNEIERAPEGDWLDALMAEAAKRGLEA